MKKLLKEIAKIVLDEINAEFKKDFQMKDIFFEFTRDIMTNETENISNAKIEAEIRQIEINTILNVAVNVGDEQTLKAICEVMDWDFKELQGQIEKLSEEQNTANAKALLEGVVTDEEIEEPEKAVPVPPVE